MCKGGKRPYQSGLFMDDWSWQWVSGEQKISLFIYSYWIISYEIFADNAYVSNIWFAKEKWVREKLCVYSWGKYEQSGCVSSAINV